MAFSKNPICNLGEITFFEKICAFLRENHGRNPKITINNLHFLFNENFLSKNSFKNKLRHFFVDRHIKNQGNRINIK